VPAPWYRLRLGIGEYKNNFAEAHTQSRLGISYKDFRQTGNSELPNDLYRDLAFEIKNHFSNAELIVAGFIGRNPAIFKISGDSVWSCDDFAVIGAGTQVAESSLYHREQSFMRNRDLSVYCVYEAKRLSQKAPGVGKMTQLFVIRLDQSLEMISEEGLNILERHFAEFAPRPIHIPAIPAQVFKVHSMPGQKEDPESTTPDPSTPLP
jgi:hypothetical protein